MPLFFFFVNRPVTIIPYVIGEIFIFLVTFFSMKMFPFDFFFVSYGFTMWYLVWLIKYYLFDKKPENRFEILGVELIQFNHFLGRFLIFEGLALVAVFFAFTSSRTGTIPVVLFFAFTCIAHLILTNSIVAKFISECLKENIECKNMNIQRLYEQVRTILVKNI